MSVTGSCAEVFAEQRAALPGFLRDEAARAGRLTKKAVARATPVGRKVNPKDGSDMGPSGELKRGWRVMHVTVAGNVYESGAENDVDYSSYVNDGTRAHIIRGRMHLAFWDAGQLWIVRSVKHPGAPGVFMAETGLAEAARQMAATADIHLQRFLDAHDV